MKPRVIKFRAWCLLNGQGSFIHFPLEDQGKLDWEIFDESPVRQQFTDVLDKNDKEIYEGDILKLHDSRRGDKIGAVYAGAGGFYVDKIDFLCYGAKDGCAEDYEIIGNIFENPELIP